MKNTAGVPRSTRATRSRIVTTDTDLEDYNNHHNSSTAHTAHSFNATGNNEPSTPQPSDQEVLSAGGGGGGVWQDDSFSQEEHFLSPASIPGMGSWEEGHSFDSASDADRRAASNRDRRKQFDATTPTLIDEEDIPLEENEEDERERGEDGDGGLAIDQSRSGSVISRQLSDGTAMLRRTPGAIQMHQSAALHHADSSDISFVGQRGDQIAATTSSEAARRQWVDPNRSIDEDESVETQQKTARPPLAPGGGRQEARGPFAFAPWAKQPPASSEPRAFSPNILRLTEDIGNLLHEDEDDDYTIEIPSVFRGEGEFSGNTSGNSGNRNNNSSSGGGEFEGDWTGSYVFDQQHQRGSGAAKFGHSRRGGTVQRPSTVIKDGRARRRSTHRDSREHGGGFAQHQQGSGDGGAGSFFPIAMQPKPRPRNEPAHQPSHQLFHFGNHPPLSQQQQSHHPGGGGGETHRGGPSPQIINFGGAFVPPSPRHSQQQQNATQPTFLRPIASTPANAPMMAPFHQHPPQPSSTEGPPVMFEIPPHSFEPYQQPAVLVHPVPTHQFQPPDFAGREVMQQQQQSEMHATAQEFIPMSTRSSTPQFLGSPDQWHAPTPLSFEAQAPPTPMTEPPTNWHSGSTPSNFHLSPPGYNINAPGYMSGDVAAARASTTPSPHLQAWQPPDPVVYRAGPSATPVEMTAATSAAPPPPPPPPQVVLSQPSPTPQVVPAPASAPSPDISQGNRSRKEPRRNTRGRKKKPGKAPPAEKQPLPAAPSAASAAAGKKKAKEAPRDATVAKQETSTDEAIGSASEDPADAKRAELEESPATRIAFKDFYRAFRLEERHSFQRAEELAQQALKDGSLPESIHWRVYLELADLARRSNRYIEARRLYQKVCQLQPFASQGWLEYSKLEEDCGFMNRVSNILHAGLEYCEYSETLLTRAVKHQEKMGNLSSARAVLARLKHVGIDKVWRTVLEGALLEARAGNYDMARRVLKYLMHHVPWYGPLYLEAYKLERDQGHPMDAMQIVERGLTTLPRYGPLWFGAFRLYEEMDVSERQFHLPRTMLMIERAKCTISKELVWKLHLEAAQMLERTALAYVEESGLDLEAYLPPVRRRLILTILTCPQNLRWKVWLAAGRMELVVGNVGSSHSLFQRAHGCVQQKSKSATLLDCARLAEFKGDVELARGILTKARSFYGNDWKVWFESVLVEIRNDNHARGYEIAANGLGLHMGSGRLWATLVQLGQLVGGDETQLVALERALSSVPKSGEVWCEGARIHLNPFACTFDLHRSRRYLHFAARFTPQFGDSFIESIRLEVLSQWLYPIAKYIWKKTKGSFSASEAANDELGRYVAEVCLAIAVARRKDSEHPQGVPETKFREIVSTLRRKLKADNLRSSIDLTDLRLACTNADPNYGSLWFHCRRLPTFTPRRVIEHAAEDIADEIFKYANIYLAAMIRRMAVLAAVDQEMPQGAESSIETSDPAIIKWENYIDKKLRDTISLQDILEPVDPSTGLALLESAIGGSLFITGLSELNRHRPLESMTLLDRRRALFGTDALFP